MKQILIFSGTTEGRQITEVLADAGIECTVCVATEYGIQVMENSEKISIHQGRMSKEEMQKLIQTRDFTAVVDATHPFATVVSENIRNSAEKQQLPYLRLKRNTEFKCAANDNREIKYFTSNEICARELLNTQGNILLTIGSKELSFYCQNEKLRKRLYVRVLPGIESIALCNQYQISGRQILALQGPFSEELNIAIIREYQIKHLVTKESGAMGGFIQKADASEKENVKMWVIGNPEKTEGLSFTEVCRKIESLTGIKIKSKLCVELALVGIGMGDRSTMTQEAAEIIGASDYLFGAKRLLEDYKQDKKVFPYYLAKDILPHLNMLIESATIKQTLGIGILFSGDSGFYSGCEKMYEELLHWREGRGAEENINIRIYPGISSVSCLSAACGISWQDAVITSIHGRSDGSSWKAELLEAVRYHKKTVLLLSGAGDLRKTGALFEEELLSQVKIYVGYQMTYSNSKIMKLSPKDCMEIQEEGLYTCLIVNENVEKRFSVPIRKDSDFIRGKIPMTKDEIRKAVICKLQIHDNAVVYDIGSGTGSVAVEIAERSGRIQVFAIEQKEEAVFLIQENCRKFHVSNLTIIQGTAPEGIKNFPKPTHAFIGGSKGRLNEILQVLYTKNPNMRIVLTAISLETIGEITELLRKFTVIDTEIVQMQISRAKSAGAYHIMQAENPVFICSFQFVEKN